MNPMMSSHRINRFSSFSMRFSEGRFTHDRCLKEMNETSRVRDDVTRCTTQFIPTSPVSQDLFFQKLLRS
ncbi:hypothetical protein PFISCL1PPCAC_6357 [Pristionchus fissidentatus]|uniref:Uncharacterized protein n=1 Tax=Pristionchus fissidentatus TaxID=1538716 RepID=A0AAV5VAY4_9BILA|nr:hypothetical protein PFISCL1PPCAC_6357 [Pristionchus fissidentatus]